MRSCFSIFVLAVLGAMAAPSMSAAAAEPSVPEKVKTAMQDRNYADAVKAIDEALAAKVNKENKDKEVAKDYLQYLKGRALYLGTKYDESIAAYDQLEKDYPKSAWDRRARFGKALALTRKGDFKAAELIYKTEAEFLLSPQRKHEIASIYLEFADSYFKPKVEHQKPDYQKAMDFYRRALEVGPKPETKIEVELLVARCQQNLGQHAEAAKSLTQFIKDHPDSLLVIEARYRLGESQMAQNQHQEARRTWQDLLALHPDAKNERVAEAAFKLASTFGLPNPGNNEDLALGVAALESFIKKYPDHKLASKAHLQIAEAYMNRGRHEDAVKSLQKFLADLKYADREEVADARNLLGRAFQVQKKFAEALEAWKNYLVKHPSHHAWSEVQQQIVNTEYLMGVEAAHDKQFDAARKLWNAFMAKYPLDARNPSILYAFGSMNFEQDKWDEALSDWRNLVSKYPGSAEASQGQFMIAATYETKLSKLDEALKEYKKTTWGNFARQAQSSIARLTSKTFTASTERVFRTNEAAKVKLVSRNVETLTVRAYRVDLETYFRKMHAAGGIEGLDISLIDPDVTFEYKVPKYVEYQQLENEIEIPLQREGEKRPAAGVMAVTISSKTMEATTLVIRSDLDVIVKSSRDEVFVFAENMLTGKPWSKAHVLISDGARICAEEVTGDDGVLKTKFKELAAAGDVRVFAVADASVASNMISLQGIASAEGLADRGYIYTDRPAYRAGQMVHVRGIIRRVDNHNYIVDKGKKFTVEVFDVRNRQIWQEEIKLNEYGSLHTNFVLPQTSPAGAYRIQVRDDDHNYQGQFLVHEYQLEPVRLTVESERKVLYRGEELEGTIKASFYYGAPLVGREVTYQLAGGRMFTAKTDAKGEIHFKLPTRDFRESQVLPLVATLAERNLQTSQNFYLATQGFSLAVSTIRPVYVAGETFEVTVKATDAEGKPTAQKLSLNVLEQTVVEGKVGEHSIEKHELATDKTGAARQTLKLEKGGKYLLRVEGTDRFENPVSGQLALQISDEQDLVRLRVLADKHTYKVGETGDVQIHWREEPALALVTFQASTVLDYKLVQLVAGTNKLSIPMSAKLSPNFELAVAVMTDARAPAEIKKGEKRKPIVRYHQANSPFVVERDLKLSIETKRKPGVQGEIRPGEEIELLIKATDPQGKPVAAEVSVAMIEQALLQRFGDPIEPITDFFRGVYRPSSFRNSSSVVFAYRPATRPINAQLLAEAERTELAEEEKKRLEITPRLVVQEEEGERVVGGGSADGDDVITAPVNVFNADRTGWATGDFTYDGSITAADYALADAAINTLNLSGVNSYSGGTTIASGTLTPNNNLRGRWRSNASSQLQQQAQQGEMQQYDSQQQLRLNGANSYTGNPGNAGTLSIAEPQSQSLNRAYPVADLVLPSANVPQLTFQGSRYTTRSRTPNNTYTGAALLAGNGIQYNRVAGPGDFDTLEKPSHGKANSAITDANTFNGTVLAINGGNLSGMWNEGRNDFAMVNPNGEQVIYNFKNSLGDSTDQKSLAMLAGKLSGSGAVLLQQMGSLETGYWNPAAITDKNGQAAITLTMPDVSTAWTFTARGITTESLAGQATVDVTAKKDLFGELKVPAVFTDGDHAEIQATIHNNLLDKGAIEVVLKTTIGGKSVEDRKTLSVTEKGIQDVSFKATLQRAEQQDGANPAEAGLATFELTVSAADKNGQAEKDISRRAIPIRPYGLPVFVTAGGTATSDDTIFIESPKDMPLAAPSLQLIVGPTVESSLLDIVLGPMPIACGDLLAYSPGMDGAVSDLMASLALQKLLGATRDAGSPQAQSLDARIRSALSLLNSSQKDDGGWSWTGYGTASHPLASARAYWALSLSRAAGYKVPDAGFEKARSFLNAQIAASAEIDYETKAILLHALATSGHGDFTLANRLYRNRPALSSGALVHLALAFAAMDRQATAKELVDLLATKSLDETKTRRLSSDASLPWSFSPIELHALYALALQQAVPDSPKAKEQIDWLMAHRSGTRWNPEKATGPATLALSQWYSKNRFDGEHYKLTIFVNDLKAKEIDVTKETGVQTIDIPARLLKAGKQRINIQIAGRGRYTHQAILSGFVAADKLTGTTKDWTVTRIYEPAPLELDGQDIPRGFGVLSGSYNTFRNPLTQLPVGKRGHVELHIHRDNVPQNTPDGNLEYLVVTEPIPSGASVAEKSIRGGFERFELSPGAITFYIGNRHGIEDIHYDLHGYLPGQYRGAPTTVRNAYRPEQLAVAQAKSLTVLPLGEKSNDQYRLTPQELYELGKRQFAKHNFAEAGKHLADLLEHWNANPDTYKDAVRMLVDVSLELSQPKEIVRYFEIIKEKYPDLEFPFEKILKVGSAYAELGEYERSYLVFRATVEGSFNRESAVAGFLEAQGEFVRSVDVMSRLLLEYPPESYVAEATYNLAQRVYSKAPDAAADTKLREKKINRVDLIQRALGMLDGFLTAYPEDPAADQAAFSVCNVMLELHAFKEVIAKANQYAERYKTSDYLDSYWYVIGYGHFALGQTDEALKMSKKVAESKRIDRATGREIESPNKWQAIYIMGQVYHSLGKAAEAIAEYSRVEDRFADAKQAIEYFMRKEISLPEVTTIKPGSEAEVELKFRNVANTEVKVYRIDLLKFGLLKRNLAGITQINLSGIRPQHEATEKLGDGKDYRDRTHKLALPIKDEGAYLVVCRGDDLHTSGLVLVSPLKVDVQEEGSSGRVRVTVKDVINNVYVPNVHVKVIGSRNSDFVSGQTDLRGVYVADGIQGTSTVLAQGKSGRYAFFRGTTELGQPPAPPQAANQPAQTKQENDAKKPESNESQLLENLNRGNSDIMQKQNKRLQDLYDNNQKALPAKAFK